MATSRGNQIKKELLDVLKELRLLNAEIDKFNKAGATRQEVDEKYGKKLKELQQAYFDIINVVKKYENANKGNAKTNKKLQDSLKSLVDSLNTVRGAHNSLTSTVQKQSEADKKLSASLNQQGKDAEKTGKSVTTFGDSFRKAFTPAAWGSAIASITKFIGIYQIYYALLNAVKDITFGSIKVFIDFQETLGRLGAVSGATSSELKAMETAIRSVAVETKFTADEMAGLSVSLAKLGVQAADIPKFLGPIALAAQATGESLDKVGETIIKVNNQFGLSASESSQTAALLVSAINDSALSLDTFNTAIQYVGPIADQVGLTFEQTSAYMKELSDNGFTASRIGTGLRSIFIELKQSGEPLNDTLKRLAKENLSVAEAVDLVGKRAAAQLLSILRNIDATEKQTSIEESLAATLKASAAEMSTVSGQLKLLKSAYNELQISIGESITSSEIFLDLIGLLSDDTERLARGYRILNVVATEASDTFTNELGKAVDGTSNAFNVLKNSVEKIDDKRLTAILNRMEKKGVTENMSALVAELEKMSEPDFLDNIIEKATGLGDLGDEAKGLIGALLQIQRTIDQEKMASEVRQARTNILQQYQKEIDAIERITNLKERDSKLQSKQNDFQIKLEQARKQLEDERFKSVENRSESAIRRLEGEISGYQRLIANIADASDKVDEDLKKQKEAAKVQFKLDSDRIKLKQAEIKEELKRIKTIRDARIKEAEERASLERAAAQTTEERANAEIKLNNAIAEANADAKEMSDGLILGINELANESANLAEKYTDGEFSSGIEQLSNSVNGLFGDFASLRGAIEVTFTEQALDLVGDAKSVLSEYGEELDKLKEKYGENAESNIKYINTANEYADAAIDNLRKLLDGINTSTEEGKLLQKIIYEQIDNLDATRPKLKEFGKMAAQDIADGIVDGIKAVTDAMNKFNDVILENQKDRVQREIEQVENRYQIENDIIKSQLDNRLITEEEYRYRAARLRKKQIGEENTLEKALFDAERRRDKQKALTDYLEAIASIVPELIKDGVVSPANLTAQSAITAALATFSYGAELSAIAQRKFIPKTFAEGGMVEGPSHAAGGVPFTVQGRGGYEMEGGEFIVNKRAAQLHRNILERINNSTLPSAISGNYVYGNDDAIRKFALGGVVGSTQYSEQNLTGAPGSTQYIQQATKEQLDYLRAIAAATTSTAVGVSKPVRAYVTNADLNINDTERKIKERNTRI